MAKILVRKRSTTVHTDQRAFYERAVNRRCFRIFRRVCGLASAFIVSHILAAFARDSPTTAVARSAQQGAGTERGRKVMLSGVALIDNATQCLCCVVALFSKAALFRIPRRLAV